MFEKSRPPLSLIWYSVYVGFTSHHVLTTAHPVSSGNLISLHRFSDWWFSSWDAIYLSQWSFNYRLTLVKSPCLLHSAVLCIDLLPLRVTCVLAHELFCFVASYFPHFHMGTTLCFYTSSALNSPRQLGRWRFFIQTVGTDCGKRIVTFCTECRVQVIPADRCESQKSR